VRLIKLLVPLLIKRRKPKIRFLCTFFLLRNVKNTVSTEIKNYSKVYSMVQTQSDLDVFDGGSTIDDEMISIQNRIDSLKFEKNIHVKRKREIEGAVRYNSGIAEYIKNLQLIILHKGEKIPVSESNLLNYNDSQELLESKIYDEESKISKIEFELRNLKSLLDEKKIKIDVFSDLRIVGVDRTYSIDVERVTATMEILKEKNREVGEEIKKQKQDSEIPNEIYRYLKMYAEELKIENMVGDSPNSIFERNFNDKSGTRKQKLVLSFRLAYLSVIKDKYSLKLPIIIDSLNHGETDTINIEEVINLLKNKFSDHQIIVSSLYGGKFADEVIEISGNLMRPITLFDKKIQTFDFEP